MRVRVVQSIVLLILSAFADLLNYAWADTPAALVPVGQSICPPTSEDCQDFDAIVFVHGIYGGAETFKNSATGFDWPAKFPRDIDGRGVDIFRLNYESSLSSWAKEKNPQFVAVAKAVLEVMMPLRKRQYRSIGFIAHSLGGNIVSTYIHMVKTSIGHPQRSQHAFIINLATPVLGAQIADIAGTLKSLLGMDDDLLASLKKENLYLRMLNEFRLEEVQKEKRYVCRPVHLHAAYEEKFLGPLLIVDRDSAAVPISQMVQSPVVGFKLNHSEIAKPTSLGDPMHRWVEDRIIDEYRRLATWQRVRNDTLQVKPLCDLIPFRPE